MFEEQTAHVVGWKAMAALGAAAMLGLGGLGVYAEREHRAADQASAQTEQMASQLSSTRNEMDQLNTKINELNVLVAKSSEPQAAPARAVTSAPKVAVHKKVVEDSRYKKLQSQVDAQGKAIDETRSDLSSTRTELTGSIARTHGELVVLQKRGERNYYEFDVAKSKQFNFDGPVGVRLKKANVKHDYADLELMIDDRPLSQKHVNIYQPVMFYTPDIPQPIELVINNITKDRIRGYISSPKYRQSELAAMQAANANAATAPVGTTTTSSAMPVRQKLPAPR